MTQCICRAETEQVTGGLESALHFLMLRLSARWVQVTFSYHAKRRRKKKHNLQQLKTAAVLNISAALTKEAHAGTFFISYLFPLSPRRHVQLLSPVKHLRSFLATGSASRRRLRSTPVTLGFTPAQ